MDWGGVKEHTRPPGPRARRPPPRILVHTGSAATRTGPWGGGAGQRPRLAPAQSWGAPL